MFFKTDWASVMPGYQYADKQSSERTKGYCRLPINDCTIRYRGVTKQLLYLVELHIAGFLPSFLISPNKNSKSSFFVPKGLKRKQITLDTTGAVSSNSLSERIRSAKYWVWSGFAV